MIKFYYSMIVIMFFVNFSIAFMPYLTRKTENFGVSIPESAYDRPDFKAMRKKYSVRLNIVNISFILLFIAGNLYLQENTLTIIFSSLIVIYLLLSLLFYLPFHHEMKKIKQSEKWHEQYNQTIIIDPKFRVEKLIYPNYLYVIPFLIVLIVSVFTWIKFDLIPEQVPIHTSFFGEVTYGEKTFGNVFLLPSTALILISLFVFVNYIIKQAKQQISAANPNVSRKQNIIFRRRWSLFLFVMSVLLTLMFSFLQLTLIYQTLLPYQEIVIFIVVGLILFGVILLSFTTGQGGSRVKLLQEEEQQKIERDDDRYWKLGQFYVNKNDPSIFVEKRFGIGWTNNWAHPLSWILIIVILGLAIGLPIFIQSL